VCLFAEGEISRMGSTLPFRRGMQRILKGRSVPVVPVHLDRVYGSLRQRARRGRVQWWPTKVPCPVTVSFGEPMPADTPPAEVRRAVDAPRRSGVPAARRGTAGRCTVRSCARCAARRGGRASRTARASGCRGCKDLAAAIVLARRLRAPSGAAESSACCCRRRSAAALAAIAASLSGRTSVPLNFTVGSAHSTRRSGRRAAHDRHARARSSNASRSTLPAGVTPLCLEDLLADVGFARRTARGAAARAAAGRSVARSAPAAPARGSRARRRDDPVQQRQHRRAEGRDAVARQRAEPTATAIAQLIPLDAPRPAVGVLPLFHSFGNFALWYAAQQGAGIVFHPNPLDAAGVGELTARHRATILLATPTFLQLYLRRCDRASSARCASC
jgi:acyl-[acyl-carrier-protein]-phospholipid O-acyltransferase/long-chain-fatty-acid--[acyl-carrier-protein] ligase